MLTVYDASHKHISETNHVFWFTKKYLNIYIYIYVYVYSHTHTYIYRNISDD